MLPWGYCRYSPDEERTVENKKIWEIMQKQNLTKYSFGILMSINDWEWSNAEANGQLVDVYPNYPDARKHRTVFDWDHDSGDRDMCLTYEAIEIIVTRLDENKLILDVRGGTDALIFDVFTIEELNELLPVPIPPETVLEPEMEKFEEFSEFIDRFIELYGKTAKPVIRQFAQDILDKSENIC